MCKDEDGEKQAAGGGAVAAVTATAAARRAGGRRGRRARTGSVLAISKVMKDSMEDLTALQDERTMNKLTEHRKKERVSQRKCRASSDTMNT
ncbi:hypothetical protein E2C01_070303 [Portunus trituberculatus]|uniref:Uncharacterized protein n=1 Tax=Portunus trituberculatus TaxID=210409 RepID=A0A5B7I513_PORTR|nr:hypothetical protein [Portunus trituberculatus]